MEHRHLTANEPEWLAILGRLTHDFYHRPEYCRLDGEPQQAETVAMDLSLDETGMWKNIRDDHQWTIRKCKRLGFETRMVPLHEHIDAFMEIYRETMDRVHARDSSYFGRDYFIRLAELREQVHCCFVELGGGVGGTDDRLLSFKRGFSPMTFPFFTLRLITDPEKYRTLTPLSASAAAVPLETRLQNDSFPAYRTPR